MKSAFVFLCLFVVFCVATAKRRQCTCSFEDEDNYENNYKRSAIVAAKEGPYNCILIACAACKQKEYYAKNIGPCKKCCGDSDSASGSRESDSASKQKEYY